MSEICYIFLCTYSLSHTFDIISDTDIYFLKEYKIISPHILNLTFLKRCIFLKYKRLLHKSLLR
jgi:hypothetical protein